MQVEIEEVWETIPGFPRYQVSNLGRVRSKTTLLERKYGTIGRKRYHYKSIRLYNNGTSRHTAVHRVVWQAFRGEIPEGYHVDHRNHDRFDNRLCNLQCITHIDNQLRKVRSKRVNRIDERDGDRVGG